MRANLRVALRVTPYLALMALAALTLSAVSCGGGGAEASIPGGQRTIYLTALEYKGSTEASKEPFPTAKLPVGNGYGLKEPSGDPPKWEVNSYAWAPGSFTVAEGDEVTLQIIGVNGAEHLSTIEGHVDSFTVKRGQITTVKFTAGKPGVYKFVCNNHMPNMVGQMIVLPVKK